MNTKQTQQLRTKLILANVNGIAIQMNAASIDLGERTLHHGEYKGVKVKSPASCQIGETLVFWPDAKKPFVVSMNKADFGVLATQFLQAEGHTVTLNSAA